MRMLGNNLFKHSDYRSFLRAYADDRKKKDPNWTFGSWARVLKLKATTSLTMILNGQRNPGPEITEKLVQYFKFNHRERQYFLDLVALSKIKTDLRLKAVLLNDLRRISPAGEFKLLDFKTFAVISNWYFLTIRQMTKLIGFNEDPEWIKRHVKAKITTKQIKEAVSIMLELGLLVHNDRGQLEVGDQNIDTGNDIASEGIKQFHEQMIDNARQGVRVTNVNKREYAGLTLTIRRDRIEKAKSLIRHFVDEFDKEMDVKAGDSTYQLNVQFFPLADVSEINQAVFNSEHEGAEA